MITLQHTAVYVLALTSKHYGKFNVRFERAIPWLLLPDAIRAYIGARQPSHFEATPDGTDVSWMEFPTGEVLQFITKETASEIIHYHFNATKYPKCVIGEDTHVEVFDRHNYGHHNYSELRMHLLQDVVLDKILREKLIDATGRFDDHFVLRQNGNVALNGQEVREHVKLFEEWGFLHLVGKIYTKTGMLLNQHWFEEHVYTGLVESYYPEDLVENTYRFIRIPDEIEEKINNLDFSCHPEMVIFGMNAEDLKSVWDLMYSISIRATLNEM